MEAHTLESYSEFILPLVNESIESLGNNATQQEKSAERLRLEEYVFERIDEGKNYFLDHFIATNINAAPTVGNNNFGHLHVMFEAFALSDPEHLNRKSLQLNRNVDEIVKYIRSMLQLLINMDRIEQTMFTDLMGNIGPYLALVTDFVYGDGNLKMHRKYILYMQFWRVNQHTLPHWFSFVKIVLLHHPNSCGSERLFSLLKYIMESEHDECLDDYIQAAVYTAYNARLDEERLNDEL